MTDADQAADRPRGGDAQQQDGCHPEEHEEEVSQSQRPSILLVGAEEVATGGKVDPRADAAAQQVDQQRQCRCESKQEKQRRQQRHGSCWRAAKARRNGTPNGWAVSTTSYPAPAPPKIRRQSAMTCSTVARYAVRTSAMRAATSTCDSGSTNNASPPAGRSRSSRSVTFSPVQSCA